MRKDMYSCTVSVDWPGIGPAIGIVDQATGGEIDSNELKYLPGGMKPQISLGGSVTTNNLTVQVMYESSRFVSIIDQLVAAVGKAGVTVTKQPLDQDGIAFGRSFVYQGTLKQLMPPEHDSTSSDVALLGMEISVSSVGTAAPA
jgi:hypothetical protein